MKTSSKTNWDHVAKMEDQDIDTSDITVKKPVTLRLDADVLEWFKAVVKGYQTQVSQLLRKYMETQHIQSKAE